MAKSRTNKGQRNFMWTLIGEGDLTTKRPLDVK